MECRIISKKVPRSSGQGGFTLPEVVVASLLAVLVAAALLSFALMSSNTLLMTRNYLMLDAQARTALDRLTSEVRQALTVTNSSTNRLSLVSHEGKLLTFAYDPDRRSLLRVFNGATNVLLADCDRLQFALFASDPQDNTFDLVATTNASSCKAVRVEWDCSKTYIDRRVNAVNNTSATIVLRMK